MLHNCQRRRDHTQTISGTTKVSGSAVSRNRIKRTTAHSAVSMATTRVLAITDGLSSGFIQLVDTLNLLQSGSQSGAHERATERLVAGTRPKIPSSREVACLPALESPDRAGELGAHADVHRTLERPSSFLRFFHYEIF